MQLHYTILGQGSQPILAFHGIGQTGAECYQSFADAFGELYTVYAFDLPFHGQSLAFTHDPPIDQQTLQEFLTDFIAQQNLTQFSVIGYSIGGRFALAIAQLFPERLHQLILLAPDGLYPHPLYRFATATALTRRLFKFVLQNPTLLFQSVNALVRLGVYPNSSKQFVVKLLDTPSKRAQIYHAWVSFRLLQYAPTKLYSIASERIYLCLAKYDYLIPSSSFTSIQQRLPNAHLTIFPTTHFQLMTHFIRYWRQVIMPKNDITP